MGRHAVSLWVWGLVSLSMVACSDPDAGRSDTLDTPDTVDDTSEVDVLDTDTSPDTDPSDIDTTPDDTIADTVDSSEDTSPDDTADTLDTSLQDTEEISDTSPEDTPNTTDTADTTPPPCPWERYDLGLEGGRVDSVAFDPRAPGTAWSFSGGAAFRSTDGGATWSEQATDIAANFIAFPPADLKEVLIGSSGLSISRDSGQTFDTYALTGLALTHMSIDPALPQRVWVGVNGLGVLRSDDAGRTFFPRNNGISSARILSITGFPDRPDTNLVGVVSVNDGGAPIGQGRIFRSTNAGGTWTIVSNDVFWVTEIATCPARPGLAFAAARAGARITEDYGLTWRKIPSLENLDVLDLAPSADCNTLYVAAPGRGVYRVTDDGATIEGPMVAGLDLEWSRFGGAIVAHPSDPKTVLLGSHSGLFQSTDGGFSWRRVSGARGLVPTGLAWSPTTDRLYLSTFGSGLWSRSSEGRWSRAPRPTMDFLYSVALDQTDPMKMVVGSQGQGWSSNTGVAGLALRIPSVNVFDAVFLPSGEWLASTQTLGFRRSTDGLTWTASNDGIAPWPTNLGNHIDVRSMAVEPPPAGTPARVYGGSRGRGVILSNDDGRTWRFVDNTLSQNFATKVLVDALDGQTVYALTDERGVFISTDRGETWSTLGTGHESLALTTLVQDPITGALYVGQARGPVEVLAPGSSTWTSFRRFCGDAESLTTMTIQEDTTGRWLVGSRTGNRVMRTRLDAP